MKVAQLCLTLSDPMDCSLPGSSVHRILQARIVEWVAIPFSRDLLNPGIEPRSPALQADSLLSEPPGKSKNTGVGSLSLLQGIFLTQESNWGLLHCQQICYQLSYQGSPQTTLERIIHNTQNMITIRRCVRYTHTQRNIKKIPCYLPFATWVDLESVMLSEISHTEKDKYYIISLICGIL